MIQVTKRRLNIPDTDRVVGFTGDNLVEKRIFEVDRMYGDVDLALFDFKLDTQIGNTKNIINLEKTVTDGKIILTWTIYASHILTAGRMAVQIRAFRGEVEKWHPEQDYVLVQPSINATEAQPDPLPSEFVQMEARVTAVKNDAEEAAQTATEHADRAQGIADTFEQTTLPEAIQAVEAAGQAKVDLAEQQVERVEDIIQEAEQDVLPELRQAIEDAGDAKDLLNGSIEAAGTAKSQLDGSISAAGPAKTGLDGSISSAGVAKTQLDGSISSANGIKSQLDGSITAAGQAKELLDESIATGDLDSFKADYMQFKSTHLTASMPHQVQNLQTGKTYRYGLRVSAEGQPQIIYEEVV